VEVAFAPRGVSWAGVGFATAHLGQSFLYRLGSRADCTPSCAPLPRRRPQHGDHRRGVEAQQQLDALAGIGCTEVQGILFSPAVPGDVVMDMLRTMSVLAHATLPSAASEPAAAAEPVTAW
jgi:hypothetical protein